MLRARAGHVDGPRHLDAGGDAQLDEDVAHVRLDRLAAEEEGGRDLAVRLAVGRHGRDLELALRQRGDSALAGGRRPARLCARAELAQFAAHLVSDAHRAEDIELGLGLAQHGDRLCALARLQRGPAPPGCARTRPGAARLPPPRPGGRPSGQRPPPRAARLGRATRPRAFGRPVRREAAARAAPPPPRPGGSRQPLPRGSRLRARRARGSPSRNSARRASSARHRRFPRARAAWCAPARPRRARARRRREPSPGRRPRSGSWPPPVGDRRASSPRTPRSHRRGRRRSTASTRPRTARGRARAGCREPTASRAVSQISVASARRPVSRRGSSCRAASARGAARRRARARSRSRARTARPRVVPLQVRLGPAEVVERLQPRRQLVVGQPVDLGGGPPRDARAPPRCAPPPSRRSTTPRPPRR